MEGILTGLISNVIGGADTVINSAFNGLIDMYFNSENYISSNFGSTVIDFSQLKALILTLAISLIVLKFLKKVVLIELLHLVLMVRNLLGKVYMIN